VINEPLRRFRVALRRGRRSRKLAISLEVTVARALTRARRPGLVWANTVKSASYVRACTESGVPVVLHAHEAGTLLSGTLDRYPLRDLLHRVQLAACAPSVRSELASLMGIREDDVALVRPVIDLEPLLARRVPKEERPDPPIVGAVGTADERKGADLFVSMAAAVDAQMGSSVEFEWLGARVLQDLDDLVLRAGLHNRLRFIGPRDPVADRFRQYSVFVLTSRVDSYPLVVLEAMALGVPVVAFDVGSVGQQLGGAGVLVPPEEPELMAREVAALLNDPGRWAECARLGVERVTWLCDSSTFREEVLAAIDGAQRRAGSTSTGVA
jgi:glycosyltransferase involved in cell wall biosynthesis